MGSPHQSLPCPQRQQSLPSRPRRRFHPLRLCLQCCRPCRTTPQSPPIHPLRWSPPTRRSLSFRPNPIHIQSQRSMQRRQPKCVSYLPPWVFLGSERRPSRSHGESAALRSGLSLFVARPPIHRYDLHRRHRTASFGRRVRPRPGTRRSRTTKQPGGRGLSEVGGVTRRPAGYSSAFGSLSFSGVLSGSLSLSGVLSASLAWAELGVRCWKAFA